MSFPPYYYYGHLITPTFDWNTGTYFHCKKRRPSLNHPRDCACWQRWYRGHHQGYCAPRQYHGSGRSRTPYLRTPYHAAPYPQTPYHAGAYPQPPNYGPTYPQSPFYPTTPYGTPYGVPPQTPYSPFYPYNLPPRTASGSRVPSPFIPPSIFHQSTPVPQPRNYPSIHDQFGHDYRGRPRLVWDVSRSVKHARVREPDIYQAWKLPHFKDVAVYPRPSSGQPLLITASSHPLLQFFMSSQHWGPISIKTENEVTVGDIMKAIYDYLQEPLTDNDKKILKENPRNEEYMHDSLKKRVKECFIIDKIGLSDGYRRIDTLGGQRTFGGLVWGNTAPDSTDVPEIILCLGTEKLPDFAG